MGFRVEKAKHWRTKQCFGNLLSKTWYESKTIQFCKMYFILLYRHGCFTEKYTTCKIHKNYIRDSSGLFSIISQVSLSMISLISSLSLKLYLNSLVYDRNIFGSSSKVFGNFRQSSGIFGHLRKFSENVRERWSGLRNNFGKNFGNLRKAVGNLQKIIKNAVISMSI